jgi:hypothetical protein
MRIGNECRFVVGVGVALVLGLVSAALGDVRAASSNVPARCSGPPVKVPFHNGWAQANYHLAPAGPIGLRLCRYVETARHPRQRLVGSTELPPGAISRLVGDLDALNEPPAKHLFTTCPALTQAAVAHLAYVHGESVTIYVDTSCFYATNGDIRRRGSTVMENRVIADLKSLTGG